MTEQVIQMGERAPTIFTRSGLGKPADVNIDTLISEEDKRVMHERWKDSWPTRLDHRGGIKTVKCRDIVAIGYSALSKVYGVQRARRLLTVAESNTVTR